MLSGKGLQGSNVACFRFGLLQAVFAPRKKRHMLPMLPMLPVIFDHAEFSLAGRGAARDTPNSNRAGRAPSDPASPGQCWIMLNNPERTGQKAQGKAMEGHRTARSCRVAPHRPNRAKRPGVRLSSGALRGPISEPPWRIVPPCGTDPALSPKSAPSARPSSGSLQFADPREIFTPQDGARFGDRRRLHPPNEKEHQPWAGSI